MNCVGAAKTIKKEEEEEDLQSLQREWKPCEPLDASVYTWPVVIQRFGRLGKSEVPERIRIL